MGFVSVAGCLLATPYLSEILHLLVLAGACTTVVIVTAVVLRLVAPKPGLTTGLLEGAAWGLLLVVLAVGGIFYIVVTQTY